MRSRTIRRWTLLCGVLVLLAATSAAAAAAAAEDTQAPPPPPPGAPAEEPRPRRRFRFGPEVGVFIPANAKTRDRFGASWTDLGPGFGAVRQAGPRGRLEIDVSVFRESRGNRRAFFAPVGVGYRRDLAAGGGAFIPYAGASVNLVLADLRSDADGVRSGLRAGGGGSLFVGSTLGRNAYAEARYLAVSRIKGFDLSGTSLSLGVRF